MREAWVAVAVSHLRSAGYVVVVESQPGCWTLKARKAVQKLLTGRMTGAVVKRPAENSRTLQVAKEADC